MSFFVSFELENDEAFFSAIQAALSAVDDLRGAFGDIARDFFKSNEAVFSNEPGKYEDYFDTKHGLNGEDTPYAQRKIDLYGRAYPMLVASGRLKKSLTGTPNADSIVLIGKRSLALGTDVPYGIYHQSDEDRSVMPLRKFLFIGPEARRYVSAEAGRSKRYLGIIDVWVTRQLKRKFNK